MPHKKFDLNKLNEEYGTFIIEEYLNGAFAKFLAKKYLGNEKDYRYINSILELNKIPIRSKSATKQLMDKTLSNPKFNGKQYNVNQDYFKHWTHNMAYILGYIATDGNISENRVLKLGLRAEDESLLYKIKEELGFTGNIYKKTIHSKLTQKDYYASVLNIYNKEICLDLNNLNITTNKSLQLGRFDFIPEEYEIDFLLGVFDGDGSIGLISSKKHSNVQIRLRYFSGSYDFISYIRDIMAKHGFSTVDIIKDERKNPFYSLCYSTKDSIGFYNKAYNNVTIWLDSKKEKYQALIEKRKEYEQSINNQNILKFHTV